MASQLGALLREFTDTYLKPGRRRIAKAQRVTAKLQQLLHTMNNQSIDRIVPLGSYAKKTSISDNMDLDLHVFLNDELPPFTEAKEEIAGVLRRKVSQVTIGTHGLKLMIDSLPVDLILASNFRNKYITSISGDVAENQIDNVLYYLRNLAGTHVNKKSDFSTSLSEGAVAFEKRHSAFSHSMSRLAKFWSARFEFPADRSLKGQSSIMEYLGARAAEEEERTGSQDLLQAFLRFLEMVANPDGLCIYWTCFYKMGDIPADILRQRPLLLDPSNPYDNFLGGMEARNLKVMSGFAKETITRLNVRIRSGNPKLRGLFKRPRRRKAGPT